ncbi:SEL1-like repeat protein [Methanosarcinaceae archaeon]|nr:SEL1-like repeat protein [Methanosarcinaceae archaeon]
MPPVRSDPEKAFFWFRKAAESGNADAQAIVADHYLKGDGVEKNRREAFRWYRRAADAGQVTACVIVGTCYEYGFFVRKNDEKAEKYYDAAAAGGELVGEICRNRICRRRAEKEECLDDDMTSDLLSRVFSEEDNIPDAAALFREIRFRAVQPDAHPVWKNMTASCYELGIGTKADLRKAFLWYSRASADGWPEAQRNLAGFCENGIVTEPDTKAAVRWYTKAALGGDLSSALILGNLYACGKYVRKNKNKALMWYLTAIEELNEEDGPSDDTLADVLSGDLLSGDVLSGDLLSGDVLSGDLLSGDVLSGDILSGDVLSGDILSGNVPSGKDLSPEAGMLSGTETLSDDLTDFDLSDMPDPEDVPVRKDIRPEEIYEKITKDAEGGDPYSLEALKTAEALFLKASEETDEI